MPSPRDVEFKPWVFISYSTKDAGLAEQVRTELENNSFQVWQDRTHMDAGEVILAQIGNAIAQIDHLILLFTTHAMQSKWVAEEIRLARQEGIPILPLLDGSGVTDNDLPSFLRKRPYVDLQKEGEFARIFSYLRNLPQKLRYIMAAPDKPTGFVERPKEFAALKTGLLDEKNSAPVAISPTLAMVGAGGFGKTLLATALCHDPEIQERFDEGILWVTLGAQPTPQDLLNEAGGLIQTLAREAPPLSMTSARIRLRELLKERAILLVIDDVWRPEDLEPFLDGGKGTVQRLVTTRNRLVLPEGSHQVTVDVMEKAQALAVLGAGLPNDSIAQDGLRRLVDRFGCWPLLLALSNGRLRQSVRTNKTLAQAIAQEERRLDRDGVAGFDSHSTQDRNRLASKSLDLSIQQLKKKRRLFLGIAIFPEDVAIPLREIYRLWHALEGWEEDQGEALLRLLGDLSLLQRLDFEAGVAQLHDIIRTHLRTLLKEKLATTQQAYLSSFQLEQWADLPLEETHLWQYLQWHLEDGGQAAVWLESIRELRFLVTKAVALKSGAASVGNLVAGLGKHPEDERLVLLLRRFRPLAHRLGICPSPEEAMLFVAGYLPDVEKASLLGGWTPRLRPRLEPLHPLPDTPDPALLLVLAGHTGHVHGCAFSPDGTKALSASADHTLRLWEVATGACLRTLKGHTDWVNGCVFSPNGVLVLSASDDRTLRLWEVATGECLRTLKGHTSGVLGCAFSPDNTLAISASKDNTLWLWNVATGRCLRTLEGHTNGVMGCAFSPDGDLVLSASVDHTLRLWDVATGRCLRTLEGHTDSVRSCAFSRDGVLALSASDDKTLRLWEVATGACLRTLEGHKKGVNCCAFSSDGTRVLSASDDYVLRLWDVDTGVCLGTLEGHTHRVMGCTFSPDGTKALSASWDRNLRLWAVDKEKSLPAPKGHTDTVWEGVFSPDGTKALSASWDHTMRLCDVATGECLHTLAGHTNGVMGCAFSLDGGLVLSASKDKTLRLWDVATGVCLRTLEGHTRGVNGCAFSPDGTLAISASRDYTLRLWEVSTGVCLSTLEGHMDWVWGCVFSPDGTKALSASSDKTLKLWDVATGECLRTLEGHASEVLDCAFSPDATLALSASGEQPLRLWEVATETCLRTLEGHTDWVTGCAFSPDGTLALSTSGDRTLRLWEVATGRCLHLRPVINPLRRCAISPDGQHVLAGGISGVYFLKLVR